jgi:hypothetical protein
MNTEQKQAASVSARKAKSALSKMTSKKNRTLSLNDRNYLVLSKYCAVNDLTISEVVDELIAAFVEETA